MNGKGRGGKLILSTEKQVESWIKPKQLRVVSKKQKKHAVLFDKCGHRVGFLLLNNRKDCYLPSPLV